MLAMVFVPVLGRKQRAHSFANNAPPAISQAERNKQPSGFASPTAVRSVGVDTVGFQRHLHVAAGAEMINIVHML